MQGLQRIVYVRRVLAAAASRVSPLVEKGEAKLQLLVQLLDRMAWVGAAPLGGLRLRAQRTGRVWCSGHSKRPCLLPCANHTCDLPRTRLPLQLQGVNGGLVTDRGVRAELAAQLFQFRSGLVEVVGELCSASAELMPLEVSWRHAAWHGASSASHARRLLVCPTCPGRQGPSNSQSVAKLRMRMRRATARCS